MMYWKEIPVQVEFTQDKVKKTVQLDEKFQISVDSIAMKDGSYGSDDYLDSWEWVKMDPVNNDLNETTKWNTKWYNVGRASQMV